MAGLSPLGYQRITNLAKPAHLTPPPAANYAVIAVERSAVRYRDDGVAPTTTSGQPLAAGSQNIGYAGNLAAVQFIEQTPGAALSVTYYTAQFVLNVSALDGLDVIA